MKKIPTKKTVTLKSIQQELIAILEKDIAKFSAPQYHNQKNAAFLQLITA